MKKTVVIIILCAVAFALIGGGYSLWHKLHAGAKASQNTEVPSAIIVRTDQGFVPDEVTIKQGQTVLWKNESKNFDWPASNIHPTHGIYPEFDPKRPIAPGEEWSFKFDRIGSWQFHDHLQANILGKVNVTAE